MDGPGQQIKGNRKHSVFRVLPLETVHVRRNLPPRRYIHVQVTVRAHGQTFRQKMLTPRSSKDTYSSRTVYFCFRLLAFIYFLKKI